MTQKFRILIVDDEDSIVALLRTALRASNREILTATSFAEGREMLEAGDVDLLVADKNLPDGSGIDLLRAARELWHSCEAIMITGFSDLGSAMSAIESGVFRYVRKPLDLPSFRLDVEQALEKRRLQREAATRRMELEETNAFLLHSESRFRELADSLPHGIYEVSLEGRIVYANRRAMELSGYTSADLRDGLAALDMFSPEDRERVAGNIGRLLQGEQISASEYTAITKGGDRFPILTQSLALKRDGEVASILGSFFDITERKEAEQKLREAEVMLQQSQKMEAVGRLAGGIAHDFNNVLSAIKSYAEVIRNEAGKGSELEEDVDGISAAVERAATLTRQLLAFGRRQVLNPKVLSLNRVVGDIESMLRRVIGEDVRLISHLADELPHVRVDPGQVEQILVNLAVNAREAMPEGGKLIIETTAIAFDKDDGTGPAEIPPGEHAMLSVTDTGTGMDEATVARVFEPFFTTKEQGTGLGLSTVYGIIKQSGGGILVHSVPGQGTSIKVFLPTVNEQPLESLRPGPAVGIGGAETVLLVEDEDTLRRPVARNLRSLGYRVFEARSGDEALIVHERRDQYVDLLLTDVVMPRMSGRELADELCRRQPGLRVLYMSGHAEEAIVHHGVLEEGIAFIQKPFSTAALDSKIRQVLSA